MDIQSDPMPKGMDIPVERRLGTELGFMPSRLEILTGHPLIINKGSIQIKIFNHLIVSFLHLIVESLCFRLCISQAPGAGEIIEISTALLRWKDIEDNRFSQGHQVV